MYLLKKHINVNCPWTYATWNIRTRQVWYIFDADIVTVMEEKNNIVLIVNWSGRYILNKPVLDQ